MQKEKNEIKEVIEYTMKHNLSGKTYVVTEDYVEKLLSVGYSIIEKKSEVPFDPDPPKTNSTNSDGTKTSPMSRAKQLAQLALKHRKKREEGYVSHAQRKAVWANRADGGKGHPDKKKNESVEENYNWKVSHGGKDVHVKAPHAGAAVKKAQKGFGNMDLTKAKVSNLGKVGAPTTEATVDTANIASRKAMKQSDTKKLGKLADMLAREKKPQKESVELGENIIAKRAYEIMKPTKSMNHGVEAIKKTMKVDHGTATRLAKQVMDKVKKGEFKESIDEAIKYSSADHVKQPEHAKNFAGDEHYKHSGGEHSGKPAKLSDKQAMDHHRASIEHDQAASHHDYMADRATSANARYHHRHAAETHRQASEHHDRAHYTDATHHDVHMAHHIGQIANEKSQRVQSRVIKKKRVNEEVQEATYGTQAQRLMSPLQKARQDKEKADRDRDGKLRSTALPMRKKNEENVQELKKSTLGNYVKGAAQDAAAKAYSAAQKATSDPDQSGKDYVKSVKRQKGIAKATDKLTKEAGTPERLAMIRKAGEKINKEKKKAERDAKRAMSKDKDMMGEAKSFDQKFRDHLKFSMSKSPAVQAYLKKRRADKDAAHAKQDPKAVKLNYGRGVIPPGTAYRAATKRGMNPSQAANAVSTAFKNRAKGGKLPK